MVIFCALVFLNFIIAEVNNSYQKVKDNINALIYKERAGLISEAEDVMPSSMKQDLRRFPNYIVSREVDI